MGVGKYYLFCYNRMAMYYRHITLIVLFKIRISGLFSSPLTLDVFTKQLKYV
jgi:hypothetical protein